MGVKSFGHLSALLSLVQRIKQQPGTTGVLHISAWQPHAATLFHLTELKVTDSYMLSVNTDMRSSC